MSLIGKIRHFFDPGYYEPEKEESTYDPEDTKPFPPEKDSMGRPIVNSPQLIGFGDNPEPGSVDVNCEDTPYVILKDIAYKPESDLLSDRLDAAEISYQIVEHNPTHASRGYGDTFYERYYVPEEYLDQAIEIADAVEEEVEASQELPDDLADVDEDTVLVEQPDGTFVDSKTLADSLYNNMDESLREEDGSEAHFTDGEDTYLIGTDFVLIRNYADEEEMVKLIRCYKQEGIPYTVTTARDEPDAPPFDGYRVYATSDCKNKARSLAEEVENGEGDGAEL